MAEYLPETHITLRDRHPAEAEASDGVEQAALWAITTAGSPTSIAATICIDEVLATRSEEQS